MLKRLLATCLLLLACALAAAQGVLPVPALTARVIDQTGTLDDVQRQGLEDKLAAFEHSKGTQIAILMVPTTRPEDIVSYANRVANAWKIGRREVGDGVLVVVAKDDRRVRIEVAKTLEGAVPDLAASQIIQDAVTPRFRTGDFAGGLQGAVDQLIARISGESLPAPAQPRGQQRHGGEGIDWFDSAIFLFFAVPVAGALLTGGGVGGLALLFTQSLLIAGLAALLGLLFALFSSAGFGGPRRGGWGTGPVVGGWGGGGGGGWSSGGGGGGGGGFSSGGGGDFGGGGASGDW